MSKVLKKKTNGLTINVDLSGATVVFTEQIKRGVDLQKFHIDISEESMRHNVMGYTTDIGTLELILSRKTLRSSCLLNSNLNDPMEKERVGVSKFAGSKFITCFCQLDHECVPFWMYYGKNNRKDKVLMQFCNFSNKFEDCFYTDYALVANNKKCYFRGADYGIAINNQWRSDKSTQEYDLRACISSIDIFDIEYVPLDSAVFTKKNAGTVSFDFEKLTGQTDATVDMQAYDATVLGRQKSNPWDYEKETRILCTLSKPDFSGWEFVDLRLKPEMFRSLRIILSPWDDGTLRSRINDIISNSELPIEIIKSIEVIDSGLNGKLNFPEC